mgnify:CR=1 FL=1
MMNTNKVIAIDGPSASGKSTVARELAEKLDMLYVDSGSFYRAITWYALENDISINNPELLIKNINNSEWNFYIESNQIVFSINGFRPINELRTKEIRESVALVAKQQKIRNIIVDYLRKCIRFGSLVIEGRDIGSAVFPNTPYKFYLDADIKERAYRRYNQQKETGDFEKNDDVLISLNKRDSIDINRAKDPLIIPNDAIIIDSTNLTLNEVSDIIIKEVCN